MKYSAARNFISRFLEGGGAKRPKWDAKAAEGTHARRSRWIVPVSRGAASCPG